MKTMDEQRREALFRALALTRGSPTETAKLLHVSRTTVYRWIARYGWTSDVDRS